MKGIKIYHYALSCSITVYWLFTIIFHKCLVLLLIFIFPIMLALCLMLSMTHYAQNYASIIGGSLPQGGHTKRLHRYVHIYKPTVTHIKLTRTHANTHTLATNSKITNAHRHINTDSPFKSICVLIYTW